MDGCAYADGHADKDSGCDEARPVQPEERAGFQVVKDPKDRSKLALAINGQPIGEWFKEQLNVLFVHIQKIRKNKL